MTHNNKRSRTNRLRRISAVLTLFALCGSVSAETVSSKTETAAATQLINLGYLSEGYTSDDFETAVHDFCIANDLPEGDGTDNDFMMALMSSSARSQYDYLASLSAELDEMRTLTIGDTGEDVSRLQRNLVMYGYCEDHVSDTYDEETADAVRRFQLACGLNLTGIADRSVFLRLYKGEPRTYDEFLEKQVCGRGDSGDPVRTLQVWLRKLGANGFSVTGSYGLLTARAVRYYQKKNALTETGNADTQTIHYITEDVLRLSKQSADPASNATAVPDWSEMAVHLIAFGYEPDAVMNSQSQLALMKYQFDHGLATTAALDRDTTEAILNEMVPISVDERAEDTDFGAISTYAFDLIGTRFSFFSSYGLPEYVYLKCGHMLPNEELAQTEPLDSINDAKTGDVILLSKAENSLWGVALGDGGVVCLRSGIVVAYYPEQKDGITAARLQL